MFIIIIVINFNKYTIKLDTIGSLKNKIEIKPNIYSKTIKTFIIVLEKKLKINIELPVYKDIGKSIIWIEKVKAILLNKYFKI